MIQYTLKFSNQSNKSATEMSEMKPKIKQMMLASLVMSAGLAFAEGANDTLITFSTNGAEPDRYADGEVVMDGECYALVWSKDGVFEGIRADGEPIDSNDKVVLVAAVAENGHCPEVVILVAPKMGNSGLYKVLRN